MADGCGGKPGCVALVVWLFLRIVGMKLDSPGGEEKWLSPGEMRRAREEGFPRAGSFFMRPVGRLSALELARCVT